MLLKRLPKALVADTVADPEGKKKKKKKKALRDDVRVWSFPQSFDAKCISTGCWRSSVALVLFVLTCFLLPPVCFSGSEGKCIRVRVNAKGKKGGNRKRGREEEGGDRGDRERNRDGVFDSRGTQEAWPVNQPSFISFLLYKENMDTSAAIGR